MNCKLESKKWGPAIVLAGLVGCANLGDAGSQSAPGGFGVRASSGNETSQLSDEQAADIHFAVGRSLERQGKPEQALVRYQEAIRQDSNRADAVVRAAVLLDRQGKFDQAADLYRRALEIKPGNPDIYCNMGYSLYLQRRWPEAEMNLRQALALKSDHRRARVNLGMLLARTERAQDSFAEFRQGGCTKVEAHSNIALACAMEGNPEKAKRHYELALDYDPHSQPAKKALARLERIQRQVEVPKTPPPLPLIDEEIRRTSLEIPQQGGINVQPTQQQKAPKPIVREAPVIPEHGTLLWMGLGVGTLLVLGFAWRWFQWRKKTGKAENPSHAPDQTPKVKELLERVGKWSFPPPSASAGPVLRTPSQSSASQSQAPNTTFSRLARPRHLPQRNLVTHMSPRRETS